MPQRRLAPRTPRQPRHSLENPESPPNRQKPQKPPRPPSPGPGSAPRYKVRIPRPRARQSLARPALPDPAQAHPPHLRRGEEPGDENYGDWQTKRCAPAPRSLPAAGRARPPWDPPPEEEWCPAWPWTWPRSPLLGWTGWAGPEVAASPCGRRHPSRGRVRAEGGSFRPGANAHALMQKEKWEGPGGARRGPGGIQETAVMVQAPPPGRDKGKGIATLDSFLAPERRGSVFRRNRRCFPSNEAGRIFSLFPEHPDL